MGLYIVVIAIVVRGFRHITKLASQSLWMIYKKPASLGGVVGWRLAKRTGIRGGEKTLENRGVLRRRVYALAVWSEVTAGPELIRWLCNWKPLAVR